jgi:two-component system sensor histidine kinase KdpD
VGNLLDVTRLESGQVRPQLDWHDARDLVQTTLRELQRELASHPISSELPPGPLLVRLDYSLVQHALGNLLLNAVTHTPAGTLIEVKAQLLQSSLQLSVADRGPGIPAESLPRVFDKFFRAPNAPTGGSGLGLTIAKGFVEAQGGSVQADNRPGGGAIFTLRLPQPEKPPTVEPG